DPRTLPQRARAAARYARRAGRAGAALARVPRRMVTTNDGPGGRGLNPLQLEVESLDLDAHGVARNEGKVVFVRGALPGERVEAEIVRRKPKFDVAQTTAVLRPSSARVAPRCPPFGVCGGCSMQHVDPGVQMAIKQRALEDQLWHLGKVRP